MEPREGGEMVSVAIRGGSSGAAMSGVLSGVSLVAADLPSRNAAAATATAAVLAACQ